MPSGADPLGPPDWALFATWHALIERGDPRFVFLSTVLEVGEPLDELGKDIRASMWNAQRHHSIDSYRNVLTHDADLQRRGVEMRMVLPPRVAVRRSPLASSFESNLRLAPVAHPLMIHDARRIVLGDATGESVWTSTDRDVVSAAVAFYERLWRSARPPVPAGEDPPFTPRMVRIALMLVDGASDREIARALGVSERTVSADVREMGKRLGARSRAHAIALISGVEG